MRTYTEKSAVTVTARAVNNNGALFVPTNARYRVDDLTSRDSLVPQTSLTPATSMTISIPPSVNVIIDSTKAFEVKVVTVETDFDLATGHPDEYFYRVKNLQFVSG